MARVCQAAATSLATMVLKTAVAVSVMATAVTILMLCQAAVAAGANTGKGDYAKLAQPHNSQSAFSKSIYLTPKGDRLKPAKSNRIDRMRQETAPETARPVDDAPFVAAPDMLADPDALADYEILPEITIPSDPHALAPAQAAASLPRKKPRPKKTQGRPIDVAMRNGRLKLNRFHTLTLDMKHHECREFPNIFVADYELPRHAVDILADNMLIIQKRICADNGAVMITCYQNSATISLRRAKPGDGCKK